MKRSRNLPNIRLSENANLWIAAFAIAFVAWVFAKTAATEEAELNVPVVPANVHPSVDVRVVPRSMWVSLRYPKNLEPYISSSNFRFEVDTADLRDNLGLEWKSKNLPLSERQFVATVPRANRIELTKIGKGTNSVRVEARYNAQPAVVEPTVVGQEKMKSGLQLAAVRPIPREVWLVGSPEALATVPRDELTSRLIARTEPINVADKTQPTLEAVPLRLPPGVEVVQRPSRTVEVNLDIQEVQTIREVKGVKIDFQALSPESVSLEYQPKTATVTLYGPASLLQQVTPESLEIVPVRPAEEVPGTTKDVPLEARLLPSVPDEVRSKLQVRSIDPKTIRVRYAARAEDQSLME